MQEAAMVQLCALGLHRTVGGQLWTGEGLMGPTPFSGRTISFMQTLGQGKSLSAVVYTLVSSPAFSGWFPIQGHMDGPA